MHGRQFPDAVMPDSVALVCTVEDHLITPGFKKNTNFCFLIDPKLNYTPALQSVWHFA